MLMCRDSAFFDVEHLVQRVIDVSDGVRGCGAVRSALETITVNPCGRATVLAVRAVLLGMDGRRAPDEAFSTFVVARQAELARLGWALTGDPQLGEDLVQSALQRMWPHWSRVAAAGDPLAYTQRIMVNLWSNWRSRRQWQVERVGESPADLPSSLDPTTAVDDKDSVDSWLAHLPPRQRAVVVLRFLLDLGVAETADRLGCSPGTVKSQTSKALDALRQSRGAVRTSTKEATS
jgi:RNA polymerase sigma-70 factor (sigma-E family)